MTMKKAGKCVLLLLAAVAVAAWSFEMLPETGLGGLFSALKAEASAAAAEISYVDRETNVTQSVSPAAITGETKTLSDEYYCAYSDTTVSQRLTVASGKTVYLILPDGVTLTCSKGIEVPSGTTLIICGQENDSGRLIANSESGNAGIGGNNGKACGDIIIHGGNIEAKGNDGGSAGIGGGKGQSAGNLTIYGGKVTGMGGNASAGIGGGSNGGVDNPILIHGGTIRGNGSMGGAGIGGGNNADCSSYIAIYGGHVTGMADTYLETGAGIGSGSYGNFNSAIRIIGGTVIGNSGNGAGIGCGANGSIQRIEIEGGNIHPTAATGAAIGAGQSGSVEKILISGGDIHAKASHFGAGIGGGGLKDFGGEITISGGTIHVESAYGAGIGSGASNGLSSANMGKSALIKISGGSIDITTTDGGAGIGAGTEASIPFGGECEGTVEIRGGKVTIHASVYEGSTPVSGHTYVPALVRPASIGHGNDGDDNGTLILGDNMKVSFNGTYVSPSTRVDTCRDSGSTLVIETCDHSDSLSYMVLDEENHQVYCPYCAFALTEAHHNEINPCICGFNGDWGGFFRITYQFGEHTKTVMTSTENNDNFILPEFSVIFSEYETDEGIYLFKSWKNAANGNGYSAGTPISPMGDMTFIADVEFEYKITVINSEAHGVAWTKSNHLKAGEPLDIYFEPEYGYCLAKCEMVVNGKTTYLGSRESPITVNMPAHSVQITPYFTEDPYRDIVIQTPFEGGTVNIDPEDKAAKPGQTVIVTCLPSEGFELGRVSCAKGGTEEDVELTLESASEGRWTFVMPDVPVTITAVFIPPFGTATFVLPTDTTTVEESAFKGDPAITVVDASACAFIGAYAFRDCTGLTQILLPKDCAISGGAFDGCTALIALYAPAGGTTQTFAEANKIAFGAMAE